MSYKYVNSKPNIYQVPWLRISKLLFLAFLLYINWYKEIWGDSRLGLYGSVIALTLSLVLFGNEDGQSRISFQTMTGFYKVLLGFGIYCFATGIWICVNRPNFLSSMFTYFCYLVVLFDCCIISEREGGWDWLLMCLFIVAFICCLQTIFLGQEMKNGIATVVTMSSRNNPNALSHVLLVGIFGMVGNRERCEKHPVLTAIVLLMLFYAILLTGSRKSLIAAAIFGVFWIILIFQSIQVKVLNRHSLVVIMLLIAVATVSVWYLKNNYIGSDRYIRLTSLFGGEEYSADTDRREMYRLAVRLWKKHPLFGVGFNQFKYYSWRGDYSHSTYAEVLSCSGIIGLAILFIPVSKYVVEIIRNAIVKVKSERYLYMVCFAAMIVELFLAVGNIWIYGITHELTLLCVLGIFEYALHEDQQVGVIRTCKYLI